MEFGFWDAIQILGSHAKTEW